MYLPRRPGQGGGRDSRHPDALQVLVSQARSSRPVCTGPPRFSPVDTHDMRRVHTQPGWCEGSSGWHLRHGTPHLWTAGPDSTMQTTRSRRRRLEEQQTRPNDGGPRGMKWLWYDATRGWGLPVFTRAVARRAWRGNYWKKGLAVKLFAAGGLSFASTPTIQLPRNRLCRLFGMSCPDARTGTSEERTAAQYTWRLPNRSTDSSVCFCRRACGEAASSVPRHVDHIGMCRPVSPVMCCHSFLLRISVASTCTSQFLTGARLGHA